jgi:type IV secretory pathway component VirB8
LDGLLISAVVDDLHSERVVLLIGMLRTELDLHFTLTETINGTVSPPSFWASQVKIQFSSKHSNEKYNPLGMQVINYRRDQETVQ